MIGAEPGRQLETYVAKLVESARYGSRSEVLREGVRLIQDREAQLDALDAVIARSLADAQAERGADTDRHASRAAWRARLRVDSVPSDAAIPVLSGMRIASWLDT
ncbi:type II toxin-antitoxin system ParD family antitoxin [Burkholderia sp. F1]|uniref:type II toxin-antitoxin system ParD family antitoxin n=1 Tax=Burkholderia sp. F1 TaxID=3366817 RepID=UPI003D70B0A0